MVFSDTLFLLCCGRFRPPDRAGRYGEAEDLREYPVGISRELKLPEANSSNFTVCGTEGDKENQPSRATALTHGPEAGGCSVGAGNRVRDW